MRGEKWTATKRILVNQMPTPEAQEAITGAISSAREAREAMLG